MELEQLANMAKDSASTGVLVKSTRVHLSLPPQSLGIELQGVGDELKGRLFRYHKDFDGMLLAYRDVKILGSGSHHIDEWGNTHLSVKVKAYIFRPVKGVIVPGVVVDKNAAHIGCRLFEEIRVSVSWNNQEADSVRVGSSIQLQLTHVAHHHLVTKLRGTLLSLIDTGDGSGGDSQGSLPVKKKGEKRKRKSRDEADLPAHDSSLPAIASPLRPPSAEGIRPDGHLVDFPCADRKSAKKKRRHKEQEEEDTKAGVKQEILLAVENIENRSDNLEIMPSKSAKKKKKIKTEKL